MNNIHGGDIYSHQYTIDFSANINPLGIPSSAKEAIIQSIDSCHHYPDVNQHELRNAIAEKEQVDLNYIICGNGAADLIFSLCLAIKPKKSLLLAPTFSEYEQALRSVDCSILYHTLYEESNFELQLDFLAKLTEEIDLVFLCNPNNPTGKLISSPLMNKIVERCLLNNILLVIDECFIEFLEDSHEHSFVNKTSQWQHIFVLKAFTKIYAMPGLRLGYGISSNKALIQRMREVTQPWSLSTPAISAGIAALKELEYINNTITLIKEEREYLISEFEHIGFRTFNSTANYIFFHAPEQLEEALRKEGILIRDCSNYRGLGHGYFRIAVRTHNENQILIEKIKKVRELWQNQL